MRAGYGWPSAGLLAVALVACGGGSNGAAAESARAAASAPPTGAELYQRCAICHQANGQGIPGNFTPLAGSAIATAADPAAAIRIVLNGLQGPITIAGTKYDGAMLPYGTGQAMTDAEVAALLTHVRQSWGNAAAPVTAAAVARERAAPRPAGGPMTGAELGAIH